MAKPGEDLQRLVGMIEWATNDNGNVLVESPKRLPDKDTGRLREHDVVLTFTERHHKFLVALECRDRSRKVSVPEVEAFHSKCARTGIDRGIIVSSIGFAQTALEKAASYNIGCLSMDQAASLNWCAALVIEVSERRIIHVKLGAVAERQVSAGAKLYDNDGALIGENEARRIGRNCLKDPSPPTDGPVTLRFVDTAPALHVVDENGDRVGLQRLEIDVTYEVTSKLSPFEFREYVDRADAKQLYTMAVARADFDGMKGEIMMVREGDRVAHAVFVPASPPIPGELTLSLGFQQSVDRSSADPEPGEPRSR